MASLRCMRDETLGQYRILIILLLAFGRTGAKQLIAKCGGECGSSNKDEGSIGRLMTTVAFGRHLSERLVEFCLVLCFYGFSDCTLYFSRTGQIRGRDGLGIVAPRFFEGRGELLQFKICQRPIPALHRI